MLDKQINNTNKTIIMETWTYQNTANDPTLITKINEINGGQITLDSNISASYVLKELLESLMWSNKPQIHYRYDNEHSIYVNDIKLRVEDYEFNHQKNEEWIKSQKNIFGGLDSNPLKENYPEIWRSRNNVRSYLDGLYSSGRIIEDNDIIYVGHLSNPITNIFTVVYFHIDELKSKTAIYEYDLSNETNKGLHPDLKLINKPL